MIAKQENMMVSKLSGKALLPKLDKVKVFGRMDPLQASSMGTLLLRLLLG